MTRARSTAVATATRSALRSAGGGLQAQPKELPEGMWQQIAQKAHELWEQRGRREGHDLEDWLDAEAIVMEEIHEARE